jgi:membrane protein implicated in regulation of membrane protease activity
VPVPLYLLEWLLNLVQALIFSVLSLMFILLAVEGHEHEEGHLAEQGADVAGDLPASAMRASPSGA